MMKRDIQTVNLIMRTFSKDEFLSLILIFVKYENSVKIINLKNIPIGFRLLFSSL